MPRDKTLNVMQTMGTGLRCIKLIVNWRNSSDEQAATRRSSKGPYESRCEGEPERDCSEKVASYIASCTIKAKELATMTGEEYSWPTS